jgi:hypothetical protein
MILTYSLLLLTITLILYTCWKIYKELKESPPWTTSRKISLVIFITLVVCMLLIAHYKPDLAREMQLY